MVRPVPINQPTTSPHSPHNHAPIQGVGHSLGLFVVTVIFLSVGEQAMDLDKVGSAFEWLVRTQIYG